MAAAPLLAAAGQGERVGIDEPVAKVTPVETPSSSATSFSSSAFADTWSGATADQGQQLALVSGLQNVPGVSVVTEGQLGGDVELITRGLHPNHSLVVVDGIRFSDPDLNYSAFLGGLSVGAHEQVTVRQGPQSALFGGSATGGVVEIEQQRGQGAISAHGLLEAGSFGTAQGGLSTQGSRGANAFAFSAFGGHSDNARADNAFDRGQFALRLDRDLQRNVRVGATLRGYQGRYENPFERFFDDPNNIEHERLLLATVFAEAEPNEDLALRASLGGLQRRREAYFGEPNNWGSSAFTTLHKNERAVLDASATWSGFERHRLSVGSSAEFSSMTDDFYGLEENQRLIAVYAEDEVRLRDDLSLTLAARSDHYDTFGDVVTGRGEVVWVVQPEALRLRASYGTAFAPPSVLQFYGNGLGTGSNLALDPETTRGWDAGFDYTLPGKRGLFSLTWFDSRFDDLIEYRWNPSRMEMVAENWLEGRTYGTVTALSVAVNAATHLHLAHTWREASVEVPGQGIGFRPFEYPRHTVSADLRHSPIKRLTMGGGVHWVVDREGYDLMANARVDAEDYVVARVYGRFALTEEISLRLRVENAFDEAYEEVYGYPAQGLGIYGGVDWRF